MGSRRVKGIIPFLTVLSIVLLLSSCLRVRSPGIMPPIKESVFGEWVVLSREFSPPRSGSAEGTYRLTVALRYLVSAGDRPLSGDDLRVFFDGDPIPFTFNEAEQVLEAGVLAVFGPSSRHSLIVRPAGKGVAPFPSLILDF